MARPPVLYQETRISPTPISPSCILQIETTSSSTVGAVLGSKRAFEDIAEVDEDSYARKRLATEGSVYFRPTAKLPRCFLWRVLGDRQLLELQCLDLVQESKGRNKLDEGFLTFHIPFPAEILRGGVQLADSDEKDALELFVLTAGNELYTITLKRDLLVRETIPTGFDPTTCVKKFAPSSFSFRHPYRFVAVNSHELYISLHDGGLMRLERSAHENGSQWHETFFSEGGWSGTIKSWNPFGKSQTVRWGNHELESSAIAAIAKSPGGKYVWTVSLDHTLRAWSTETGKVIQQLDLLGGKIDEEAKKRQPQYVMAAEPGSLLQIIRAPDIERDRAVARKDDSEPYFVVVHSPKDHQFKVYGVKETFSSIEGTDIAISDLQSKSKLLPPVDDMMNTNIWHLDRFVVHAGHQWRDSQLWLRARSGAICRTFMLNFDLFDKNQTPTDLSKRWQTGWTAVDSESLSTERLKRLPEFSALGAVGETATTPSDKWLAFLFYPARFSDSSLRTALQIYCKGRGLPATIGKRVNEVPLKEQFSAAVSAKILLRRSADDHPDYDRYYTELQAQCAAFFSVLSHLHNRRHESVGFAFDGNTGVPWVVCADLVAPARLSSDFEKLLLNATLIDQDVVKPIDPDIYDQICSRDEDSNQCKMLALAQQFRQFLSVNAQEKLMSTALDDALSPHDDQPADDPLASLYEVCGLANEITEDAFDSLVKTAESLDGLGSLEVDDFLRVIESLEERPKSEGNSQGYALGRYGAKLNIAIMQETFQNTRTVLLDLLALVTFMHGDLEAEELHPDFRPQEVYAAIMHRLKHNELRLWLAGHVRPEPKMYNKDHTETIYGSLFIGDWESQSETKDAPLPGLLTSWSKRWIFYLDLEHWDDVTCGIMANLLKHGDLDLATDFLRFLSDGPWHSYLKGRYYLATGDYAAASIAFQEPADDFVNSRPSPVAEGDLLTAEERTYFESGKLRYYQHVLSLFEKLKVFSYVADFASLALECTDDDEEINQGLEHIDFRKSQAKSPLADQVTDAIEEVRLLRVKVDKDEVSGRLFNALVQTGRLERAFTAMARIGRPDLQRDHLATLLDACVKQDCVSTLLELPIEGDMVQHADSILLAHAKQRVRTGVVSSSAPPYHQILFAFRTQHSDFRGAAAVLYEHLERLRHATPFAVRTDPEDETLVQLYALLINTLACCGEGHTWLLADPIENVHAAGAKRRLVKLEDIRREYAAELDRRSEILLGRFPLVGGGDDDEMGLF